MNNEYFNVRSRLPKKLYFQKKSYGNLKYQYNRYIGTYIYIEQYHVIGNVALCIHDTCTWTMYIVRYTRVDKVRRKTKIKSDIVFVSD